MRSHPTSTLPNTPNYYWSQAIDAFNIYERSGYMHTFKRDEMTMWLFLYEMSVQGE